MKQYKVITQNDKWFSGKFDSQMLQIVLNDHARQGWVVKSMCSASREGMLMGSNKDELIILLEREVPTPEAATPRTQEAPPVPSEAEMNEALERELELDRKITWIDENVADPEERKRQKLRAIAAHT